MAGYKAFFIKEYFHKYFLHNSDVTFDVRSGKMEVHATFSEKWKVTVLDTGINTMTGGRLLWAKSYLGDEPFFLTYGDGVSDVNLTELESFHRNHQSAVTLTSIQPEGRFGALDLGSDHKINRFLEKPKGDGAWINGGFFVCNSKVFDYLKERDATIFERAPLENLANAGELMAYKHQSFWYAIDTLRDKNYLQSLWDANRAPWKVWKD